MKYRKSLVRFLFPVAVLFLFGLPPAMGLANTINALDQAVLESIPLTTDSAPSLKKTALSAPPSVDSAGQSATAETTAENHVIVLFGLCLFVLVGILSWVEHADKKRLQNRRDNQQP